MAAGADSIDDLNLVRHGGMPALFDQVYAPARWGVPTHVHSRACTPAARGRPHRAAPAGRRRAATYQRRALCFVDVDSMLRRVYGKQKQGAAFGQTKVGGYNVRLRGLHPLLATISTPASAPVIAAARLRAGNAASARGAAALVAEAINTARACGATGEIVAPTSSTSPHAWPATPATPPCTCPNGGPGSRRGRTCSPPPTRRRPNHPQPTDHLAAGAGHTPTTRRPRTGRADGRDWRPAPATNPPPKPT